MSNVRAWIGHEIRVWHAVFSTPIFSAKHVIAFSIVVMMLRHWRMLAY